MGLPYIGLGLLIACMGNIHRTHALEELSPGGSLPTLQLRLQPQRVDIVLVGSQSSIQVRCAHPSAQYRLRVRPTKPSLVRVLTRDVLLNASSSSSQSSSHEQLADVQLLGLRPGRTHLELVLLHAANRSVVGVLSRHFEVVVVERLNALQDGLLYLLVAAQLAALVVLAARMRGAAVKQVLRRPCALFSAIFCQAVLVPLVSIGVSVALGLPIHTVVCLLILGCCPTGLLSPMLTVIQQGHVELAVIVTVIETMAAFGIMPLWLFAYGNFLGLAYDHVSEPYFFIAGALVLVAGPLLVGLLIQKCGPASCQRLDRALPPACLLLVLLELAVRATSFAAIWDLVTWRLLAGSGLVPILGGILGTIGSATFRQELPQTKTVTIVTCVQNTLLAKVIIEMSYPATDASVMALTLTCVDVFTVCYMVLAYLTHLCLTLLWPAYRPLHQHAGLGGLQDSIGDKIVRSMVKAGEITFGKLHQSPAFQRVMGPDGPSGPGEKGGFGSIKNRLMYTGSSLDSAYRSAISSVSRSTTPSGLPLTYLSDLTPEMVAKDTDTGVVDSLESLDYEMLSETDLQADHDRQEDDTNPPRTPSPAASSPTKGSPRIIPLFDSLDVRKPLPPLPLPPTPPYLTRRISSSDEGLHRADSRASATGLQGRPARRRHTSAASSRSMRSDATQDTSVSSKDVLDDLLHHDVLDDDDDDDVASVSTIMTSYDMSVMSRGTASTRWRWDGGTTRGQQFPSSGGLFKGQQYSPPPPAVSPVRVAGGVDLSSIEEEERSLDNSHTGSSSTNGQHQRAAEGSSVSPFVPAYRDSPCLSY